MARNRFPFVLASGALAMLAAACGQRDTGDSVTVPAATPTPVPGISNAEPAVPAQFNAAVPAVRFLRIGMPLEELKAQTVQIDWSTRNLEGADYQVATVTLETDQKVSGIFDAEGNIYSIEADTPGITDNNGIGVGAPLSDVQAAYPDGRLIIGLEEGRYANYLTGGMLVIQFNPDDLDDTCFAVPADCSPPATLPARKLVLFGTPVG